MSLDDLVWGVVDLEERREDYNEAQAFFEGDHPSPQVPRKYVRWFKNLLKATRMNLCEAAIHAVTDRLDVSGWHADQPEVVEEVWRSSDGPRAANAVHVDALTQGDAYVLVWPDAGGRSRMWPLEGREMTVRWRTELPDEIEAAIKLWHDSGDKRVRGNVYYPDRVERYRTIRERKQASRRAADWEPMPDQEVIRHSYKQVPVSPFASGGRPGHHGRSDLWNAIPIQNLVNKALIDLLVASESIALPLRILSGLPIEVDPETGKRSLPQYDPREQAALLFGGKDVQAHEFGGTSLSGFVDQVMHHVENFSRVTGMPTHQLMAVHGNFPSGESLKVSEARLTARVRNRQQDFTPAWRRVMGLLGADATPTWSPAEWETEHTRLETAEAKRRVGVPLRQVLIEMGYSESQIEDMFARELVAEGAMGTAMVEAFMRGENGGGG